MSRRFWSIFRGLRLKRSTCCRARDFRLIEIDYSERDTLACNVLSLGKKR